MLQNAYFLAKIGADTAENEQHFAEILPTDALGNEAIVPTAGDPRNLWRPRSKAGAMRRGFWDRRMGAIFPRARWARGERVEGGE